MRTMVPRENASAWDKLRAMIRASVVRIVRPLAALRPRDSAKRRVLLACGHELQARYLAETWEIFKSDPRLEFCLVMPYLERRTGEFAEIRRLLPLREVHSFWARAGHWDLIVIADHLLEDLAGLGADAVAIDHRTDIAGAFERTGGSVAIQGNFDPAALFAPPDEVARRTHALLDRVDGRAGHVLNLGHGVMKETDPECVGAFVRAAQEHGR